jgi:hypothetical protein
MTKSKRHYLGLALCALVLLAIRVGLILAHGFTESGEPGAISYFGKINNNSVLLISFSQTFAIGAASELANADVFPDVVSESASPEPYGFSRHWWLGPLDSLFSFSNYIERRSEVHITARVLKELRIFFPNLLVFAPSISIDRADGQLNNRSDLLRGMDFTVLHWPSSQSRIGHQDFLSLPRLFQTFSLPDSSSEKTEDVLLFATDLSLAFNFDVKKAFPLRYMDGTAWSFPVAISQDGLAALYPTRFGKLWLSCDGMRCTNAVDDLKGKRRIEFERLRKLVVASTPKISSGPAAAGALALSALQDLNENDRLSVWTAIKFSDFDVGSRGRLATELFYFCRRNQVTLNPALLELISGALFKEHALAGRLKDSSLEDLVACGERLNSSDLVSYAQFKLDSWNLPRATLLDSSNFFLQLFSESPFLKPAKRPEFGGNWYAERQSTQEYRSHGWLENVKRHVALIHDAPTENAAIALSWCMDFEHRNEGSARSSLFVDSILDAGYLTATESLWVRGRLSKMRSAKSQPRGA